MMRRDLSFWIYWLRFVKINSLHRTLTKQSTKYYNDELNYSAIDVLEEEHKPPETM